MRTGRGGDCFLLNAIVDRPTDVLRWDGSAWVDLGRPIGIDDPLPDTTLTDVSCAEPAWCLAAGTYPGSMQVRPLALAWDGGRWTALPAIAADTPGSVMGATRVSCATRTSCVVSFRLCR